MDSETSLFSGKRECPTIMWPAESRREESKNGGHFHFASTFHQGRCRYPGYYCPGGRGSSEKQLETWIVTLFTPSSTSALTTIEHESGALSDLRRLFDQLADPHAEYAHDARWGDGNGHSHVRAALLGASFTIPFTNGHLTLGTWQQIIFVDFDNRPRKRELVVQIMGD